MPKSQELPDFQGKRKTLFGARTSPEQMRATGKRFMEAERFDDALEFFARTQAEDDVKEIVRIAIERGDMPLFLRAKLVLKEKPTGDEFAALARRAEETGRLSMAALAHLKAGNEQRAKELSAQALNAGDDAAPSAQEQKDTPKETS